MSAEVSPRPMPSPADAPDWIQCRAVREDWVRVVASLRERGLDGSSVPEPCRALLAAPGKCLRPSLFLLSAGTRSDRGGDLPALAVAIELLHLATLFHDDVIDDAPVRRAVLAPAHRWGSAAAVYGGGYLLSEAMAVFSAAGDRASRLAAAAIERLWRGEMEEMENLGNVDLAIRRHIRIVRNKTAALFELPCALGAEIAGVSAACAHALRRFGSRVGVAFQVLDDLRDVLACPRATGKLPGIDAREGVCTLAVLHAARGSSTHASWLRRRLTGDAAAPSVAEIRAVLESTGSIAFAREVAFGCLRSAEAAVLCLPEGGERDSFLALVHTLHGDLGELR